MKVAALAPFQGQKNLIDDTLQDAVAVLGAFPVVMLGTQAVDEVRRSVQQDTVGHRGLECDPPHGIQRPRPCGPEHLTEKQKARLAAAFTAQETHL